jgi:hypothetical protein
MNQLFIILLSLLAKKPTGLTVENFAHKVTLSKRKEYNKKTVS